MSHVNPLFPTTSQHDPTSLAPLEIAEHQTYQLLVLVEKMTVLLEDPTPTTGLLIEELVNEYHNLLKQIKSSLTIVQIQPHHADFIPQHTTTHHDWLKADLSTLLVSSASQGITEMLVGLNTYLDPTLSPQQLGTNE